MGRPLFFYFSSPFVEKKKVKHPIISVVIVSFCINLTSPQTWAATISETGCTTSREFITALEFLKKNQEIKLPEDQLRNTALAVSRGCTGAAQRFIRVSQLLAGAGLSGKDALQAGLEFASRTDRETETFIAIFQKGFLAEHLDLSVGASLSLARSLSTEFEGDVLAVRDDFETLLDYCIQAQHLDLPRPQCAQFASELARKGQNWSGGLARPFIDLFEFMRSDKGPQLATGDALRLSKTLIEQGPDGPSNFIQGFRYASSNKGLALTRSEAIAFAQDLAKPIEATSKSKRER